MSDRNNNHPKTAKRVSENGYILAKVISSPILLGLYHRTLDKVTHLSTKLSKTLSTV